MGVLFALLFLLQGLAQASTPVQVTTDVNRQGRPEVSGDTIVWKDLRAGNWDIYSYAIPSGLEQPVSTGTAYENLPVTNGVVVVWQDDRNGDNDIFMRDLILGIEQPLVTGPGNQGLPAISGNRVAYVDDSAGSNDIFTIDLTTRAVEPICQDGGNQWQPRISGNRIIWQDDRSGKWDVYLYDLDNPVTDGQALVAGPGEHMVGDISGDLVVWQEFAGGQYDIMVMDLGGGAPVAVTSDAAFQNSPRISGDLVVWEDFRNDPNPDDTYYDYDIYMKDLDMNDLAAGAETPLAAGPSIQARPAVDRETVVWEDTASGNYDVWMTTIPDLTSPVISRPVPADGSSSVCPSPTVSAALSDNRTGLDPESVVLLFDGADVTGGAVLGDASISYQPGALADGNHTVSLTAADHSGNVTTREWQFQTSRPELSIPLISSFWGSYDDYVDGILSVDFTVGNSASSVAVANVQALASPASGGVIVLGLPTAPVDIAPGGQASILIRYLVPPGVASYKTTLYIGCADACGGQYFFPGNPPGV